MNRILYAIMAFSVSTAFSVPWQPMFNGKDLTGWTADTTTWRVKDGYIQGGLKSQPTNNFIVYTAKKSYSNFFLKAKVYLGTRPGFINGGIQYRSVPVPFQGKTGYQEAVGYQADMGPGYWGVLYDEGGRNKILQTVLSPKCEVSNNAWHDYTIIADHDTLTHLLDGTTCTHFVDTDAAARDSSGAIALQVHSSADFEVRYKDLYITETLSGCKDKKFVNYDSTAYRHDQALCKTPVSTSLRKADGSKRSSIRKPRSAEYRDRRADGKYFERDL